jgi:hypothetical protein
MIRYFWGRLLAAFTVLVALVVALLADAPPAAVQPGPPDGRWTDFEHVAGLPGRTISTPTASPTPRTSPMA